MHSMHYQRWNPPLSPVRIEFSNQLLREIALASGTTETRGSLYGLLLGGEIRVLAARNDADVVSMRERKRDEQLVGLEKVGIFVCRAKGEVFLTETDLERFEGQRAAVALVVAGDRAGFFVRQADGSIQTIRSHEEFSVTSSLTSSFTPMDPREDIAPGPQTAAAEPPRARTTSKPLAAQPRTARAPNWPRTVALCLAIPLAGFAYFRPSSPRPVQLRLTPAGDSVAISWNPAAAARGGALEILDGSGGAKLDLQPGQSSLSFSPHSSRVEARLTVDSGDGSAQLDSAVLNVPASSRAPPQPTGQSAGLRAQIASLEAEASELRQSLDRGGERMASLQKNIDKLTHR